MEDITLAIAGIQCSGCAMDVENILLDMDGIADVKVSITKNTIKIHYDPNEIEIKHIVERIRKLGLKTRPLDTAKI